MNDLDLLLLEDESEEVETESVEVFEDIVEDYGESKPENPTTPTSDASNFGDIPTAPPTKVETKNPRRIRKVIPGYSTKHARLKKREMLALRTEAKSLEEWLRYLQTKTSGSRISKQRVTNTERRAATKSMEETKRLQRSESINRKLKAVLRDQTKLRKSILAIIQQMTASEDKEFFFGSPCKITESYQNAGVLAQLKDGAHNLYMNLNVAVPQLPSTAYSSVMVSKADPKCGKMFEGSTVCTVSCSMKFAIDALWLEYSTPRKYENKSYRYVSLPLVPCYLVRALTLCVSCWLDGPSRFRRRQKELRLAAEIQARCDFDERIDVRHQIRRQRSRCYSPRLHCVPAHCRPPHALPPLDDRHP